MHLPSAADEMKTSYGNLAIPPRCSAMWHTWTFISQPLWKSRRIFFHRSQFYFYKNAMPLLLLLFPPSQQADIYLYPAEGEFSISIFPISPQYSWAAVSPLPELTHRQQLWAVVLFQAPQAGKLCQSESLCLLITAVRSKPKLAFQEVTFILFPTLFLCPWLPEMRVFSSSASSAWIQKQSEWSSY